VRWHLRIVAALNTLTADVHRIGDDEQVMRKYKDLVTDAADIGRGGNLDFLDTDQQSGSTETLQGIFYW
jgi:hypothetical protein